VRLESRGEHALAARRGCRACRRRADAHHPPRLFAEYVSIRQHTSAYRVAERVNVERMYIIHLAFAFLPNTSAYVSIRQHTSAYVSIRQHTKACVSMRPLQPTAMLGYYYVSIREHT
jgi:hypothetical protein